MIRRFLLAFGCLLAGLPAWATTDLPKVLSEADIERYREIFALQQDAKWSAADQLIKKLENPVLMGHVNFQKLMHPTGYRSKFSELSAWMQEYADHPNAWQVYRLARRRQGKSRAPKAPDRTQYPGVTGQSAPPKPALPRRSTDEQRSITTFFANVRQQVRAGRPDRAEKRYWAIEARELLTTHEKAEALERISASYYYEGDDFKARVFARLGSELAREIVPENDWIAGLANWRQGNLEAAYTHFKALSKSDRANSWLVSAGAFWAGRTAMRLENPAAGIEHLRKAAEHSETFYGLIAARQLGITSTINWTVPSLQKKSLTRLMRFAATKRALALKEIGRDDLADEELRLLWGREGVAVQSDLLAFATALNLPAIQTRLARAGGTGKPASPGNRYPIPDWEPEGGFTVDRALIFAMVRKESDFQTRASSRVGAGGLMQVMPATASYITNNRSLLRKRNRSKLYEPEFNIALGQQYIEYLLNSDYVDGNLLMALAAYNGGPGSLISWREKVDYGVDPLLFIESISFYETRNYIERVMANLWLYRMRIGQPTPSLDDLASGAWPSLEILDNENTPSDVRRALSITDDVKNTDD